jgi:hypothetical protein
VEEAAALRHLLRGEKRWNGQEPRPKPRCPRRRQVGLAVLATRRLPSGNIVYRVRYHGPDRQERSRSFRTRRDAAAFEAQMKSELATGDWIDPARGRMTLGRAEDHYRLGVAVRS